MGRRKELHYSIRIKERDMQLLRAEAEKLRISVAGLIRMKTLAPMQQKHKQS